MELGDAAPGPGPQRRASLARQFGATPADRPPAVVAHRHAPALVLLDVAPTQDPVLSHGRQPDLGLGAGAARVVQADCVVVRQRQLGERDALDVDLAPRRLVHLHSLRRHYPVQV